MNKKIFFILALLEIMSITKSWGIDGIVIVHQAPLFLSPDFEAQIVQYKNKGEKIYIFDQHFEDSNLIRLQEFHDGSEKELERSDLSKLEKSAIETEAGQRVLDLQFYLTVDKLGREVYIPKKFVKIVYKDERELKEDINLPDDPTDYRIKGPLMDGHPIVSKRDRKIQMLYQLSTPEKNVLPISGASANLKEREGHGASLRLHHKINFDEGLEKERFFFGGHLSYLNYKNSFDVESDEYTLDSNLIYFGPEIAYNFYRHEFLRLVFMANASYIFRQSSMSINQGTSVENNLSFYGHGISSQLSMQAQRNKLISQNIDMFVGAYVRFNSPVQMKTSEAPLENSTWVNGDRSYQTGTAVSMGGEIGLQAQF